jgi:uncharacterized protein (DUF1501 family)
MPFSRRHFLTCSSAALAGLTLPIQSALANGAGNDRKFIFVINYGGWDPTQVFSAEFENPNVDMPKDAESMLIGDMRLVDHEERSSVREFFKTHHEKCLVVKGLLVPSVAHQNCIRLMLTGSSATGRSDWPAIMASAQAESFPLPHIVVAGPSFPGALGGVVSRTGNSGQLEALLDGSIADWSDTPVGKPSTRAQDIMDRYLERRAEAVDFSAQLEREREFAANFKVAHERSQSLKGLLGVMDFGNGSSFSNQSRLAVDTLALGISRCATIQFSQESWDTHTDNDQRQSTNFQGLFLGLQNLMQRLSTTTGPNGKALDEDTVVVVLSEMGRTPQLNEEEGKDHWPFTACMVVGNGITGNRVVGGYDNYYYGELLDFASGEVDRKSGLSLTSASLGATLLNLADVDHKEFMPGISSIPGLLI